MNADRRRVLTALMIAQVMAGLAHGVTYSMGALLAADMAGQAWGGAASTVTTVGAGLWAVPLARLVRHRGRRASLSTGLVLGSLGALSALGGANTGLFPLVLLGFLFLGAAVAMNLQARFAAADVAEEETRGRDISLVVWSTTVGAVAGPLLFDTTERLGESLGLASFSGAYLVCILAQWVAVAVLQVMLRPDLRPAGVGEGASESGRARLRGHPVVGSAIFAVALAHFTMIAIMSMTAVHLHGHGASMVVVGLTVSAHVGGMYALAPVWGVLADKVGTRSTILLGCALTLACAVLLVPFSGEQTVVMVALLLLGLGWSATLVGSSAMLTAAAPDGLRTAFQGRSDLTMNIAGALGGVVAGPVVSTFGMPWMAGLVIVLVAVQMSGVAVMWRDR
ncbi:MFS transporter [Corynebacterium halotolerans]|uniref:Major facilitator superfamily permease n=1 Tax=Corynebacterium halotolerans YIM 70093 = DSM 44683 TaxID=1121362 RepID=M1MTN9_9CORY|nr:MFS transporter [Corynebacterium halotolerans]AGF71054.1 major facilitator superfamily permease [Corynebacterium halotolerans YIM 70093 = DSM 44683]